MVGVCILCWKLQKVLEKPAIEPSTPIFQGMWFIHGYVDFAHLHPNNWFKKKRNSKYTMWFKRKKNYNLIN